MYLENAVIISNCEIATGLWRLTMEAPDVTQHYKGPGQFVNILSSESWEHPIRRPMSIAAVDGQHLDILYKICGEVTKQISCKIPDDSMSIMGPLGNVFTEWKREDAQPVLVGGGVGLAPLLNLFNSCDKATLVIGARMANEHFMTHNPKNGIYLTTDDGSLGIAGTVIHALNELSINDKMILYACGPVPMLKAVQEFAQIYKLKTQLSVESYMGCGIGLCQGCVIERKNGVKKNHSYHEKYSLVCVDGPVYDSTEVSFG